jgi:hypothetical protein
MWRRASFVRSDLRSGSGLDTAVAGASVIVHCATSTSAEVEAMQKLVRLPVVPVPVGFRVEPADTAAVARPSVFS